MYALKSVQMEAMEWDEDVAVSYRLPLAGCSVALQSGVFFACRVIPRLAYVPHTQHYNMLPPVVPETPALSCFMTNSGL